MKVYVFTFHVACDGEFLGTENRVFKKKADAMKAFEEWKKDELVYVERNGWEIGTNTDTHFEAFEDGRYCTDHTEGFINEYEVA